MASLDSSHGYRALLTLAWPVVLSRSAQAVIGFSDALMSAPLGEAALTAVTAGSLNAFCVAILPMGVAYIVQSYAAQTWGKDDRAATRRHGWYGLVLSLLAALAFAVAVPLVGPAVRGLSYAPGVQDLMIDYITIRFAAMGAVVGVEALGSWYGGLGNTRFQMVASVLTMVLNVAFNWLLIEGHLGFPALGVRGAAWASVIASWAGFGLLLWWFVRREAFAGPEDRALRGAELLRMLRFGIPHGLNWFFEFAAFMFFINVVVARLGTSTTAAMLAVIQVNSVSFMPAFGISSAGAILAGQAIGAGDKAAVPGILRRTISLAASWQVAVGVFYVLAPGPIMALFAPRQDGAAELVTVGAGMLALSAAWQLFDAVGMAVNEGLRAAGDTAFPLWARLSVAWFLFLPLAYLTVEVWGGGATAAILSMVVYLAVLAAVMSLRFLSGAWRRIELTEEPAL